MKDVVLVDTMGGLGDLVLALPLVEALSRSHPGARLTVVTTAPWHVLLQRDPRVQRVVPVLGRDGAVIAATATAVLEAVRPELAVTTNRQHGLPGLLERTAATAVTDLWRRPPADEPVDLRMLRLLAEDGVIDAALAAVPPRLAVGDDERAAGAALLDDLGAERPVLLFPDSGMPVKHWPLPSWADAVQRLRRRGRVPVVVSQVEQQRTALAAAGAVIAPPLPIRAVAGLAAAAADRGGVGVGGDTGPVRLAAAAGTPVVGLFGATAAGRYGYRGRVRNLQGLPGCTVRRPTAITEQECWWTARCPLTADHAPACMADVAVDDVVAAVLAL